MDTTDPIDGALPLRLCHRNAIPIFCSYTRDIALLIHCPSHKNHPELCAPVRRAHCPTNCWMSAIDSLQFSFLRRPSFCWCVFVWNGIAAAVCMLNFMGLINGHLFHWICAWKICWFCFFQHSEIVTLMTYDWWAQHKKIIHSRGFFPLHHATPDDFVQFFFSLLFSIYTPLNRSLIGCSSIDCLLVYRALKANFQQFSLSIWVHHFYNKINFCWKNFSCSKQFFWYFLPCQIP